MSLFFDSQTFLVYLDKKNKECNYAGYLDKYLKYPPGKSVEVDPGCDLRTEIANAAILINPAFDIYRIFDMVSVLFDFPDCSVLVAKLPIVSYPMGCPGFLVRKFTSVPPGCTG